MNVVHLPRIERVPHGARASRGLMHAIKRACKLAAILAEKQGIWIRALATGVAAGVEHKSVLAQLHFATAVDIGANRGQFALAVRACAPQATLISFEPLPEPARKFRQVFARDTRTVLHEVAIGPTFDEVVMHVSARDDSSSLLPISSVQEEMFPGTGEIDAVPVRVAPLEAFLDGRTLHGAALLKLDVQGYELAALQGCESLIDRFQWVYCECSFMELYTGQALAADVVTWLNHHGFDIVGMFHAEYDRWGRAVQADLLFEHRHPWPNPDEGRASGGTTAGRVSLRQFEREMADIW